MLSVGVCAYLIYGLHLLTFLLFGIVLAIAPVIYFGYSVKHSKL
ncbi:amino acid permease C-terminal domain-containing protein, partial [Saccharothrix sp. ST-888]